MIELLYIRTPVFRDLPKHSSHRLRNTDLLLLLNNYFRDTEAGFVAQSIVRQARTQEPEALIPAKCR